MKKYKQLVTGIVIGSVLTVSISVIAEYIVNPNPYPVTVDGRKVDIEGYNINDKTYFQLRDVGQAVGFDVGFENDTITVNTQAPVSTPVPSVQPFVSGTRHPNIDAWFEDYGNYSFTSDGLPIYNKDSFGWGYMYEGTDGQYVNLVDIEKVYSIEKYGYEFCAGRVYDSKDNIVIDNIPILSKNQSTDIELNYYETVLRPWLQENCQ